MKTIFNVNGTIAVYEFLNNIQAVYINNSYNEKPFKSINKLLGYIVETDKQKVIYDTSGKYIAEILSFNSKGVVIEKAETFDFDRIVINELTLRDRDNPDNIDHSFVQKIKTAAAPFNDYINEKPPCGFIMVNLPKGYRDYTMKDIEEATSML